MDRRNQLTEWVGTRHDGQLIKKTNLPYVEHLLFVAHIVSAAAPLTYEIGLCHDLLEKTVTHPAVFSAALSSFGYGLEETTYIIGAVQELTDHYTKANYPDLSKKERKAREEERLLLISADAQTVKYADLLYNAEWMVECERKKALAYLSRKLNLIRAMDKGDVKLRQSTLAETRKLLARAMSF